MTGLWVAYAISTYGTALSFGAFPLLAVLVLEADPAQVSALAAVGPAAGALLAIPLGPWVEGRRKRPVMIAMDLVRCAALVTIPAAYALGRLTVAQLFVVAATVAATKIAFTAAAGAYLKGALEPGDLLVMNARFEAITWSSIAVGPPLGGAAIGVFGPVSTVLADAVSYLASAFTLSRMRQAEEVRKTTQDTGIWYGWQHLLQHRRLRGLFLNNVLVNGLIMATEPQLAVLMLRDLHFPPWQYGLAFAVPCLGGLVGSRLARRAVARAGQQRIIRVVGTLRVVWLIGLVFVGPGPLGLVTVMAVELAIIVCMSLYSPVLATYRLEQTPKDLVARTLTAWSIGSAAGTAILTTLAGLLAAVTGPRFALAAAGSLILVTPLLLPRSLGTRPY